MNSCIYRGTVRHRRFSPVEHTFQYPLFMMYLDLAELPGLFDQRWLWSSRRPAIAWFRRADYLGNRNFSLDDAVRDEVEKHLGKRPTGPVRVLTHLRYFGYVMNPVSFYYLFDEADTRVETIVAEVTNTPWNERHSYVLLPEKNIGTPEKMRFQIDKDFHVSPFMDMGMKYDWRFSKPGNGLLVHMENHEKELKVFDATLSMRREEISGKSLASVLLRFPWMTARVFLGIYWQAFRLYRKQVPFYSHPRKREVEQC